MTGPPRNFRSKAPTAPKMLVPHIFARSHEVRSSRAGIQDGALPAVVGQATRLEVAPGMGAVT